MSRSEIESIEEAYGRCHNLYDRLIRICHWLTRLDIELYNENPNVKRITAPTLEGTTNLIDLFRTPWQRSRRRLLQEIGGKRVKQIEKLEIEWQNRGYPLDSSEIRRLHERECLSGSKSSIS